MYVIGTAGHVDHGKSTLVKALTGIDPDRLKEEKQRQMTIDLGFAWLTLSDGTTVGIVDVPGHRDFIENTLAGIGGIDAVLLVIAADEGVMPQTREHLAIIDLLKIKAGIVVLSKVDLVHEFAWLDLIEEEVKSLLQGTALENAPIVRVSSITGEGVNELKTQISCKLTEIEPGADNSTPRLPIDRVFSISGFGTVVTGTLLGSVLHVGENVEIQPSGLKARIRGIQTYQKAEIEARPGSRTAINISGINVNEISRGDVLTLPGKLLPTFRIDCSMDVLKDASVGIKHNDSVKFFAGTSERVGRVRLLQNARIDPGGSGWVQIEFTKPIAVMEGDRYIFRRVSPEETLGGGQVLEGNPPRRYKLNDQLVVERLSSRLTPSSSDKLFYKIDEQGFVYYDYLKSIFQGEEQSVIDQYLADLEKSGKLTKLRTNQGETVLFTNKSWERLTKKLIVFVSEYHRQNALMPGIPKAALNNRLKVPQNLSDLCIEKWKASGEIVEKNGLIALPSFQIIYSSALVRRINEVGKILDANPYNTPTVKTIKETLSEELFESLVKTGVLIQVSSDVVFRDKEYQTLLAFVVSVCRKKGLLEIHDIKNNFQTSRKYSLAFLEYLDGKGITRREGEGRKLISIPPGFSDFQDPY